MGSRVPRSGTRSQASGQAMATAEREGLLLPRADLGLLGPRRQPGRMWSVTPESAPGSRESRPRLLDDGARLPGALCRGWTWRAITFQHGEEDQEDGRPNSRASQGRPPGLEGAPRRPAGADRLGPLPGRPGGELRPGPALLAGRPP